MITCKICGHPLILHSTNGAPCAVQKCKCKVKGMTVAQAKVLEAK